MFPWIRRESCLSWPRRNDVGVGSQGGVPLLYSQIPGDGPTTNTALCKLRSTTLIKDKSGKADFNRAHVYICQLCIV